MSDALSFEGSGRFKFESIVEYMEQECALIRVQMDIKGRALDEANQETTVEMALSARIYRALDRLVDIHFEGNGQMKTTARTEVDGELVDVTVAGSIRITGGQSIK